MPDDPRLFPILLSLADAYHRQSRFADAVPLAKRALEIREKLLAPDHQDVGRSLVDLASFPRELGRFQEAESQLRRALPIFERLTNDQGRSLQASTLQDLGGDVTSARTDIVTGLGTGGRSLSHPPGRCLQSCERIPTPNAERRAP